MPDSPNIMPVAPGLVSRVTQGLRYAVTGVQPSDWFGPAQPIAPMAQTEAEGRVLDYRTGYNLSSRPRDDEAIGFHQLRALADACGILRLVIETRKDQMERLTWALQPRLRSVSRNWTNDPRIDAIEIFLRRPDGHNGWATWLRQILEELLVTDAVALYRRRTAAGGLYGLQQIDGATVKRVIDDSGLTPQPPSPAYQQILHGLPAVDYTSDQLLYLPRNKRIHKLYGFSPVEQVVMVVNIALRRQVAQLNYFTEGNIPEALVSCPPDWRPSQIREMQEVFDDMLRGNLSQRSGAKFIPGGLTVQFTKDALLKDEFDEWLARIICYAFSVPPTPFVKQSNRATADNASDTAMQEGLAPLQNWVKALIDRVLAEDFAAPDLEFCWNEDRTLSPSDAMTISTGYVAAGLKTRNEVRADLGLAPVPGGDQALVTTGSGLLPLKSEPFPPLAVTMGKDWSFNPNQPRDDQGMWTIGNDDSEDAKSNSDNSYTEDDPDSLLVPAQFGGTTELTPDWDLPTPYETQTEPVTPRDTLTDPIPGTARIPDGLTDEEKQDCVQQWEDASSFCRGLRDQGVLGQSHSWFGRTFDECVRGQVSQKCGGNPIAGGETA